MVLRLPVGVWSKLHKSKDAIRRARTLEGEGRIATSSEARSRNDFQLLHD